MRNIIFDEETTIRYCKLLYGFDVKNAFGESLNEMCDSNLFDKEYKENWMWFVEPRMKVGFPPISVRDLKINDILETKK